MPNYLPPAAGLELGSRCDDLDQEFYTAHPSIQAGI